MYRKLLATTALSLILTGGAYAQDALAPSEDLPLDPGASQVAPANDAGMAAEPQGEEIANPSDSGINSDGWLASEVMGSTIFTSAGEDAESIGDVNDFVLGPDGGVAAVVVGVGGFLGIGEKNVAINWTDLELTTDTDGNQRLVSTMSREQLENAAEFDRAAWLESENQQDEALVDNGVAPAQDPAMAPVEDPAMAPAEDPAMAPEEDAAMEPAEDPAMAPEDGAMAPADDAAMAPAEPAEDEAAMDEEMPAEDMAPADDMMAEDDMAAEEDLAAEPAAGEMAAPADQMAETTMDQELELVTVEDISAEDLNGTAVYGADDEEIGNIGDIILTQEGGVEAVIIDFGGFLGIGSKPVAIAYQNLEFYRDAGDTLVLRTALTAEDLEAAPEYDEDSYMDAPNEQLVTLE